MQDYILLKDLPGLKAGAQFRYYDRFDAYVVAGLHFRYQFSTEIMRNWPEWFEEVTDATTVPTITETPQ